MQGRVMRIVTEVVWLRIDIETSFFKWRYFNILNSMEHVPTF